MKFPSEVSRIVEAFELCPSLSLSLVAKLRRIVRGEEGETDYFDRISLKSDRRALEGNSSIVRRGILNFSQPNESILPGFRVANCMTLL